MQRFLGRCSQRTIYLRFFGSLTEFTEEKAQYFTHVDGVDHFAFVALDPNNPNEICVRTLRSSTGRRGGRVCGYRRGSLAG